MGKDASFIHGSYKTWLCNTALFALICAAFAAGILLGPIVSSRRKDELKEVRCSPDATSKKDSTNSKCISRKELATFMDHWSQSLDNLIEEKMVNVSRGKINVAMRKLSRARNAATKKALRAMLNTILANWTTAFSEHINKQFHANVTDKVTMVTEQRPAGKREPEVIEVDFPDPPTPGTPVSLPVPIALYPLNGKYTTWDVSGRSNPNGIARGVRLAPGPEGHPNGSYQFSGKSGSFIEFPNMGALRAKESITLLAWVYVQSGSGPIFNYNPLGWGVSVWVNSKHHLAAKFVEKDDQCKTCIDSALPLKTHAWSYVGMSYDHTSGIAKLWVNKRVSSKRDLGTKIHLSTTRNARMGARAVNDGNYFKGRISRMQVYDKALSQQEIEAVAGPIEVGACPQGWTGYRSSCYLLFNRLTNQWNQARQACQEHGGDLVEIGSSEENHFVYALARAKSSGERYMWIGLLRGFSDESFSWINDPSPPMYSNWALGEPNNFYGRGENCGHMYISTSEKAKQWNDELCVNPTIGPMVFMCEIEPENTPRMLGKRKPVETGTSINEEISGEQSGSGSGEFSSGSEGEDHFGFID